MILKFRAITLVGVTLARPQNISISHDHLDHIDRTDNPTYLKINLFENQLIYNPTYLNSCFITAVKS